jgi:predicted amidohydrolase YtcJ
MNTTGNGLGTTNMNRRAGPYSTALAFLVGVLPAIAVGAPSRPVDLVLLHGRIYSVDPSVRWAQAIAIAGERIVAVGSDSEVEQLAGPKVRRIDLHGALVTPGMIDSHVHFVDGSFYLHNVALREATTMADVKRRLAKYILAHPQSEWIQGEGWSYGYPDMPNGEFHHDMLDGISGGHPVLLNSGMAHAAWANSEALRRAGITRSTPNPAGGEIVRGSDGEPTGWLKEDAAVSLVASKVPKPAPAELKAALLGGIREANRLGVTRIDSAGGDFGVLGTLDELRREGKLTLRISMADGIKPPGVSAEQLAALEAARSRYHGDLIECCVAKFMMDGVIESHTAYLPGGYADRPDVTGMRFFEPEAYNVAVATLNAHGFQVYTHAIGDGAIKIALNAYEQSQRALAGAGQAAAPRNRIEHMEDIDAEDIPRFRSLGVIASMQPLMIYPRDEWKGMEGLWQQLAGDRRLPRAFALRSLLDAGAVVALGTDWPVVQLNPLLGIRNAVLRQSLDGKPPGGYVPAQRIGVEEAVRGYTLDAAYAARRERDEGSIVPGKLADLVVYSRNFIEGPANEIAAASVVLTLVGGRIAYDGRRQATH